MAAKTFHVTCPGCTGQLTIDAATGEILSLQPPEQEHGGDKSMAELIEALDASKSRAEQIFEQEKLAVKDRKRLLEEKFNEALRRVEEAEE
ncbi:MAG: hypothetical protein VYE73_17570 [Acidobacteriota bacterium]|nr:hypothetical protein [Acidobacteriota bacterium]